MDEETDVQSYIDSAVDPDLEYIDCGVHQASFCLLHTFPIVDKLLYPSILWVAGIRKPKNKSSCRFYLSLCNTYTSIHACKN